MDKRLLALGGIIGFVALAHYFVIDFPNSFQKVFDEQYYIQPALNMLNGTRFTTAMGEASNLEHPFLAKAFIALGILAFGNDATGWRIASILCGLGCIPLVYVISKKSLFATALFSLDSLIFAQSSLGVLDIPMLFFLLLGFALYFRKSYWLTGIAFALALLCKETAVLGIAALLIYHVVYSKEKAKGLGYILLPTFIGALVGLQIFDSLFTNFPSALNQMAYILTYASGLKGHSWCMWAVACTNGPYLNPLNWITAYYPPGYWVFYFHGVSIGWRGIATLPVIWVGIAALIIKRKDLQLRFPMIWFAVTYLPYIPIWLTGRNTYPFYFIPAIPALCIAAASLHPKLASMDFTRLYQAALLLAALLWFFATYPLL